MARRVNSFDRDLLRAKVKAYGGTTRLAEDAGLKPSWINNWVNCSKLTGLSEDRFCKLAETLGIDPEELHPVYGGKMRELRKSTVRAFIKKPGEPPETVEIEDKLEAYQKAVRGYIEVHDIAPDMAVICDEEGRLKGSPANCSICGMDLFGRILIVGTNGCNFADVPVAAREFRKLFPGLYDPNSDYGGDI